MVAEVFAGINAFKAMFDIANDQRRQELLAQDALHGVLNQAALPSQGQELFGKKAPRQGPKARSGAAGQDNRMDN